VRYRRNVLDVGDIEPCGLEGPQSSFAAGTRAFHKDFDILDSVLLSLFRRCLGGYLRCKRSTFSGPFETLASRARPRNRITADIRDGDNRVVKGRADMSYAVEDILALFFLCSGCGFLFCHVSSVLRFLALAHNGSARPLTSAGIGVSALASNREPAAVSQSAVAPQVHETLYVHRDLRP